MEEQKSEKEKNNSEFIEATNLQKVAEAAREAAEKLGEALHDFSKFLGSIFQ